MIFGIFSPFPSHQIYLLIAKPSKFTTALFRIQLNFLNGPLLAYLFPEIESRRVALERPTYYVQHGMMFVIPIYLLKEGGKCGPPTLGAVVRLRAFVYACCVRLTQKSN